MSWTDGVKNWADVAQAVIQCLGFLFVIIQVNELRKSLHTTAHSNIYSHYVDTVRWFLDKPHLYPYLRENVSLDESSGLAPEMELRRAEVRTLCELTTTLFEHAILERSNMPSTSWNSCWLPYIEASYQNSAEMRLFFERHQHFYIAEYVNLVVSEIAPKLRPAWEPEIIQAG